MAGNASEDLSALLNETVDLEKIPIQEVLERSRCSREALSKDSAQQRLTIFGYNKLQEKKEKIPIQEVLERLRCSREALSKDSAQQRLTISGYNKLQEKKETLVIKQYSIPFLVQQYSSHRRDSSLKQIVIDDFHELNHENLHRISVVDTSHVVKEIVLEDIERDRPEYTLDEDHQKVQTDPSKNDRVLVLKKTLSCSYLNLAFDKEVQKEYEQLQLSQADHLDVGQCQVIQRLNIDITGSAQHSLCSSLEGSKKMEPNYSDVTNVKEHSYGESYHMESGTHMTPSRNTSSVSSGRDLLSTRGLHQNEEWHSDLLNCCAEPSLSCWMRRKLRKMLRKMLRIKEKLVDESEVEGEWILPPGLMPQRPRQRFKPYGPLRNPLLVGPGYPPLFYYPSPPLRYTPGIYQHPAAGAPSFRFYRAHGLPYYILSIQWPRSVRIYHMEHFFDALLRFTIHGLWQQNFGTGSSGVPFSEAVLRANQNLVDRANFYWPNARVNWDPNNVSEVSHNTILWSGEWNTHGTFCPNVNQETYMKDTLDRFAMVATQLHDAFHEALVQGVGDIFGRRLLNVSYFFTMLASFTYPFANNPPMPTIHVKPNPWHGEDLCEIRYYLDHALNFISPVGESNCVHNLIEVP